jgi:hypothetical protein
VQEAVTDKAVAPVYVPIEITPKYNTYVDVDKTNQVVTYFENGVMVIQGPCVTGNERANHGTPTGTYTITHTNYNAKTSQSVAGAWSALGDAQNIDVPGWTPATNLTTSFVTVGNGLMVVPDDAATGDFTSFTINYTFDGKTYEYTYTPASTQVEQAKHYIYEITFRLHEIFINPSVEDWADQTATAVTIQ